MSNIDNALRAMDNTSRDLVKKYIGEYNKTGDLQAAKNAVAILKNFDSDSDVRATINSLSK